MVWCNQEIIMKPLDAVKNESISCSELCVLFSLKSKQDTRGGCRERSGLHHRLPLDHSFEILLGRSTIDNLESQPLAHRKNRRPAQAKQMWSLRHRSQLLHWSWVRCWNWRWLAHLPDGASPASPVAASSASIFSTQACFTGKLSVYSTPRSARPEASAASRSNCSSRDTWLTGLLPKRTTARTPRIH